MGRGGLREDRQERAEHVRSGHGRELSSRVDSDTTSCHENENENGNVNESKINVKVFMNDNVMWNNRPVDTEIGEVAVL